MMAIKGLMNAFMDTEQQEILMEVILNKFDWARNPSTAYPLKTFLIRRVFKMPDTASQSYK